MARRRNKALYANQALQKIREEFRRLSIFNRSWPLALYNYVAAAEVDALYNGTINPLSGLHHSHRRFVESSTHAIPSIFGFCAASNGEELAVIEEIYAEARELYEFTYTYDQILYAYELADRGQFRLFVAERDPRITFVYATSEADQADTKLRALEQQEVRSPKAEARDETRDILLRELMPLVRSTKRDRCDYEYTGRLIEIANGYGRDKLERTNQLQLPSDTSLGEVTIQDLRAFWAAMMAICEIHIAAHVIGDEGNLSDLSINTIVLCKPKEEFVLLVSRVSGLPTSAVGKVLSWFTYDPGIANNIPILQPFLPLNSTSLCLPSLFVNGNNFERNFMKLLNMHPDLRSFSRYVEPRLEPAALDSITELFPGPRYKIRRRIVIAGVTDIDLLVFDNENNSVLVIQHKWLIAPDTLRESISNDEKLADGVRQAVRARDYLRSNPDFTRSRLDLSRDLAFELIEGGVVCRGLAGTGFLGINTATPVVTETAFRQLVAQANGLKHLWELLSTRPDQNQAEKESMEGRTHLRLCGYEFVMPGLAVQVSSTPQN